MNQPEALRPKFVGPKRRRKKETRYQTYRWIKLSKLVRDQEPLCKYCLEQNRTTLSQLADHIIPVQEYEAKGGNFYDRSNLCGCCNKCNLEKKRARI